MRQQDDVTTESPEFQAKTETILIINKTYPEWSNHNGYIVCVGGINQDGEWRRLYPVPYELWYRGKPGRFQKWDWIRLPIRKQTMDKDPRKESYKLEDVDRIEVVGHIGTDKAGWQTRRSIVDAHLTRGLKSLIEHQYHDDRRRGHWFSMGIIRPKEIIDFVETNRYGIAAEEQDPGAEQVMSVQMKALTIPGVPPPATPDPINKKIGYRFRCEEVQDGCSCGKGRGHYIMCTDWELGQLYRGEGFEKTRQKYLDWMTRKRDLYFMMGTVARQYPTFINVGVFYPPKQEPTQNPTA